MIGVIIVIDAINVTDVDFSGVMLNLLNTFIIKVFYVIDLACVIGVFCVIALAMCLT